MSSPSSCRTGGRLRWRWRGGAGHARLADSGFHVHDGVWVPAEDRAFATRLLENDPNRVTGFG